MLAGVGGGVAAVDGEIPLPSHAFDGLHVDVWVQALIGGDALVEEALAFLLLPPKAGADESNAVDDDHVTVGAWREFVVELERNVVWMCRMENFTEGQCRGVFRELQLLSKKWQ